MNIKIGILNVPKHCNNPFRNRGKGIIIPIFKGGNPEEAGNYRGITLIYILGKVYSQILINRLSKWVEKEEKSLDSQFGFQKSKSIVDFIFTLYSYYC